MVWFGLVTSGHQALYIRGVMASSPSAVEGAEFDLAAVSLAPDTVAVITGAAEGLGKSFASGLLEKGAKGVALADVNEAMGVATQRELADRFGEERVLFVRCDVTSGPDVDALFAKAKETLGRISLVVNNAGVMNELKPELCISVNALGVVHGTYNAIKYMSPEEGGQGGKIINISSYAGLLPTAIAPVYSATKHFVNGFTNGLISDKRISDKGITFGLLCPTFVQTKMISTSVYRHPEEDKKISDNLRAHFGILGVSAVKDAFLQLVLDEAWSGKIMTISKSDGIQPAP